MKPKQRDGLLQALKVRFESNMHRHKALAWAQVLTRLEAKPATLSALLQMEETGGEPDVVATGKDHKSILFIDCAAESPSGRRSLCYDQEALESRKENKPSGSALGMATQMGV